MRLVQYCNLNEQKCRYLKAHTMQQRSGNPQKFSNIYEALISQKHLTIDRPLVINTSLWQTGSSPNKSTHLGYKWQKIRYPDDRELNYCQNILNSNKRGAIISSRSVVVKRCRQKILITTVYRLFRPSNVVALIEKPFVHSPKSRFTDFHNHQHM